MDYSFVFIEPDGVNGKEDEEHVYTLEVFTGGSKEEGLSFFEGG